MLRSSLAFAWVLLIGGMGLAQGPALPGGHPAPMEKKEPAPPKPQEWTVKFLTPNNTVTRQRTGYVIELKEETRTVCKQCLVCSDEHDGKCCRCQCKWVPVTEKYQYRQLKEKSMPDLKIETHQIKKIDAPK